MKGTPKFSPLRKSVSAPSSPSTLDSVFAMLDDIGVRKERAEMNRLLDQIGQNRAKWTGFQEIEYEISRRLQELPSGPAQPERATHRVRVPNWPKYTPLPAPERIPQLPPPAPSPKPSPTPKSVMRKVPGRPAPWKRASPWAVKRVDRLIKNKAHRLTRLHPRDIVLDVALELAREIGREIDPEFTEGVNEVLGWFSVSEPVVFPLTVTKSGTTYIVEGAGVLRVDGLGGGWDNDAHIASPLQTFKHYHPQTDPNHEHRHWPRYERVGIRDYWKDRYSFWIDNEGKLSGGPASSGPGAVLPMPPTVRRTTGSGFSPDNKWKSSGGFSIVLPPNGPPFIEKGVPKGRRSGERKHRGHALAMQLLSGALDISTELTEYWMILRDLAGVPDSMTEREFFMWLYNGGIWEIDGNQLAIDFAANILEDVFYGRAFGAVQRAMRRAGQSTYTMPSAPSVF